MIEDFTAGMSFEQFREDPKTVAAVERVDLEIIRLTITDDLPPLKAAVLKARRRLRPGV